MSDLQNLRERLHLDLERVIGAAAIIEQDNDYLRTAVLEALAIYEDAGRDADGLIGGQAADRLAGAAEEMAARLQELTRVRVATEVITDPEILAEFGL